MSEEQVYSYDPEVDETKADADSVCSIAASRQVLFSPAPNQSRYETPTDKLLRLQFEVQQLNRDLSTLTSGASVKAKSSKVSVDIGGLRNEFSAILNDVRVAPYLAEKCPLGTSAICEDGSDVSGALVDQLKDFGGGGGNGMAYKLYTGAETMGDKARLIKLDRQIGALEKKVGSVEDEENSGFSAINDALSGLYRKLELLDGHKLEAIQRRISTLATEFELLEGNMPKLRGTKSSEKQFNNLYSHMKKWNKCTLELPQFVARLSSQVNVHSQHAETLIRLQKLRRQQLALNSLLTQDQDALKAAGKSLDDNLAVMKKNMESFKSRFDALEKNIRKC